MFTQEKLKLKKKKGYFVKQNIQGLEDRMELSPVLELFSQTRSRSRNFQSYESMMFTSQLFLNNRQTKR